MVKVLDFGISKVADTGPSGQGMSVTKTSALMGSPLYMSPEQMESSKDVDAQTDIWALGVILYELLAGRVPFAGDTLPEVCIKIATQRPRPLRSVRPEAPARLEAVLSKCLQKDRRSRYADVGALAQALSEFAPHRGAALIERISGILQAAGASVAASELPPKRDGRGASPETMSAVGGTTPGFRRKTLTRGTIGVACGAIAVAVGAFLFVRTREPTAQEGARPGSSPSSREPSEPQPSSVLAAIEAPPVPSTPVTLPSLEIPQLHPSSTPPQGVSAPQPSPKRGRTAGPAAPPAVAPPPVVVAPATPTPAPAPAPRPTAAANCDPPFFFDGQGNRVFKKECVN